MDGRTGSITVTALVGTGLATLVVALTGVAGLSGDLQAAAAKNGATTPLLSPGEELRDTKHQHLVLRDACDKTKHAKKPASKTARGVAATTPTTPATSPASATGAREY